MKQNKRNLKLLNFLNKIRKKRPGKKRRIFASAVLAGNLLFGNLKTNHLKPQNYSNPTLTHEKVISAQELNSLDDSRNSGQIVRTGNGTILEFQQEVSNASSNKILSEHNLHEPNDIILVKNDGILPGADGFVPKTNHPKRHPFGRPRMRGSSTNNHLPGKNVPGLGNKPQAIKAKTAPKIVDNGLKNVQRHSQCSKKRFDELSTDPQRGIITEKSIDEANAILEAESAGLVQKPKRPSDPRNQPNLDFIIDGPAPYKYADVKTPANFGYLDVMAIKIGRNSVLQKGGTDSVLHLVDLKNIPSAQKARFEQNVRKGAKDSAGFEFINNK